MKLVTNPKTLQKFILDKKHKGTTITFVPTMGALHEGHLSLIKKARREGGILVVSIFINPIQFGPSEDYKKYPRPFLRDKKLAEEYGVDILFYPKVKDIYTESFSTYVTETSLSKVMCGKHRPGHFSGVVTVVLKLFNIVQPDIAYFGQKDYQQTLIIKRMVKDLNLPVKIKVLPIVRKKNGLALSSRNKYLTNGQKQKALLLQKMLKTRKRINNRDIKIDYFIIVDKNTLKPLKRIKKGKTLIAVAAKVGKTRLIDNITI